MTGANEHPERPDWREIDAQLHAIFDAPIEPRSPRPGTFDRIILEGRRRRRRHLVTALAASAASIALVLAGVGVAVQVLRPDDRPQITTAASGSRSPVTATITATVTVTAPAETAAPTGTASPSSSASTAVVTLPAGRPVGSGYQPLSVTFPAADLAYTLGTTPGCTPGTADCMVLARSIDRGRTWVALPGRVPSSVQPVFGVRFATPLDGWVYGPGGLASTHDGGATWSQVDLHGQQVLDLATTGDMMFATTASCATSGDRCSDGKLLASPVTVDSPQVVPDAALPGALTQARIEVGKGRVGVSFTAARTTAAFVRDSTDGNPQQGWRQVQPGCGPAQLLVTADGKGLFAVCTPGGASGSSGGGETQVTLRSSVDGGRSWQPVLASGPLSLGPGAGSITAASPSLLAATSGSGGGLQISHDGGIDWTPVTPSASTHAWAWVAAGGGRRLVALPAAPDGAVYLSEDGGTHWSRLQVAGS